MAPADITALPLFLRVDVVATAWKRALVFMFIVVHRR
jgi:hypothetical protein